MDQPELFQHSPKYRQWKYKVEGAGCLVRKVEMLQALSKRDGSLLFGLLRTQVEDPEGRPLPAYLLLRGHASVVVTVIENSETQVRKFLMLRQRRIGHGGESLEFPAGMLDGDVEDPVGVAVRELKEETGLDIARHELHALCDRPLYSSAGLDDEAIHYFVCKVVLPPEKIAALDGGETGQADEHEHIRLSLWDEAEALAEIDSLQVRLGFYLYAEFLRKRILAGIPF